jgi:hypothetical protein
MTGQWELYKLQVKTPLTPTAGRLENALDWEDQGASFKPNSDFFLACL